MKKIFLSVLAFSIFFGLVFADGVSVEKSTMTGSLYSFDKLTGSLAVNNQPKFYLSFSSPENQPLTPISSITPTALSIDSFTVLTESGTQFDVAEKDRIQNYFTVNAGIDTKGSYITIIPKTQLAFHDFLGYYSDAQKSYVYNFLINIKALVLIGGAQVTNHYTLNFEVPVNFNAPKIILNAQSFQKPNFVADFQNIIQRDYLSAKKNRLVLLVNDSVLQESAKNYLFDSTTVQEIIKTAQTSNNSLSSTGIGNLPITTNLAADKNLFHSSDLQKLVDYSNELENIDFTKYSANAWTIIDQDDRDYEMFVQQVNGLNGFKGTIKQKNAALRNIIINFLKLQVQKNSFTGFKKYYGLTYDVKPQYCTITDISPVLSPGAYFVVGPEFGNSVQINGFNLGVGYVFAGETNTGDLSMLVHGAVVGSNGDTNYGIVADNVQSLYTLYSKKDAYGLSAKVGYYLGSTNTNSAGDYTVESIFTDQLSPLSDNIAIHGLLSLSRSQTNGITQTEGGTGLLLGVTSPTSWGKFGLKTGVQSILSVANGNIQTYYNLLASGSLISDLHYSLVGQASLPLNNNRPGTVQLFLVLPSGVRLGANVNYVNGNGLNGVGVSGSVPLN